MNMPIENRVNAIEQKISEIDRKVHEKTEELERMTRNQKGKYWIVLLNSIQFCYFSDHLKNTEKLTLKPHTSMWSIMLMKQNEGQYRNNKRVLIG